MEFIEVSAKTVDDAITKACIELGVSSDKLDIQVISEGSSGFLGFGSKPAVIRAGKKPEEEVVVENGKDIRHYQLAAEAYHLADGAEVDVQAGPPAGEVEVEQGDHRDEGQGLKSQSPVSESVGSQRDAHHARYA